MHIAFVVLNYQYIQNEAEALGRTVIDARGKILIPGIIESVSQLGLMEVGMVESTNDYGIESESPFNPSFDPSIAYNPLSTHIPINRRAGITHIVIAPRGGIISGIGRSAPLTGQLEERPSFVLKRRYSRGLEPELRKASVAHEPRSGERLKKLSATHATPNAMPDYRAGRRPDTILRLVTWLSSARFSSALYPGRGSTPSHRHSQRPRLRPKHKIRLVINGGTEAWLVRKELSDAKVPVIVYPGQIEPGVLRLWPPAMTSLRCLRRVAYR